MAGEGTGNTGSNTGSTAGGERGEGGNSRSGSRHSTKSTSGDKRSPKAMPAAYSGKHPTYNPKDPSTAMRFSDSIELAAKSANLASHNKEVVQHALSYLDHQTARKWGLLEGGHEPLMRRVRKHPMKIREFK